MINTPENNDTLTLLLANAINRGETYKKRAAAIRNCCKILQRRSACTDIKRVCRNIRNTKDDIKIINAVNNSERKFFEVRFL
tara:strand:+ start:200 stop:445 length:246 start_codon:yes stop_codon:yes gene_type:complete